MRMRTAVHNLYGLHSCTVKLQLRLYSTVRLYIVDDIHISKKRRAVHAALLRISLHAPRCFTSARTTGIRVCICIVHSLRFTFVTPRASQPVAATHLCSWSSSSSWMSFPLWAAMLLPSLWPPRTPLRKP